MRNALRVLAVTCVMVFLSTGAAAAQGINETFETQPLQGWETGPGVQVQQVGQTNALVFSQAEAAWIATTVQDLTLSFKYRPGNGILEVVVRASGEPPNQRGYHLILAPGELGLVREFGQGNMTELGGAPYQFQSGAWNQVAFQVTGGQLAVSVGGQQLLSASDPQPLPAGGVGFMSHQGGDAIDDVSLTGASYTAAQPLDPTQPITNLGGQPVGTLQPTAPVGQQQPGQPEYIGQQPPPGVQPPLIQPGQPPLQTPQPVGQPGQQIGQAPISGATVAGQMTESFSQQPQQGWEFGGGATVQNGMLTFSGPGAAWWVAIQQQNPTVRFNYMPGQGGLHLVLGASGPAPLNNYEYRVHLGANQTVISRVAGGQETQIGVGQYSFRPQEWHVVFAQVSNGQLSVTVNNQTVVTGTDPQPIPPGTIGFVSEQGGGLAIDDVVVYLPQDSGAMMPAQPQYQVQAGAGTITFGDGQQGRVPTGTGNVSAQYRPGGGQAGQVGGAGQISPMPGVGLRPPLSAAHVLAQPASRQVALQSILADPNASAQLQQSLPNTQLQQLASVAADGQQVTGAVSVATGQTSMPTSGGPAPPGTPQGITGLNWTAGVHFSPVTGAPGYADGGQLWWAGVLQVSGVVIPPSMTLADMNAAGVAMLAENVSVRLDVELPPSQGTYMISVKTSKMDPANLAVLAAGMPIVGSPSVLTVEAGGGSQQLNLTPLSDGTGLIGLVFIPQTQAQPAQYPGMRARSARVTLTMQLPSGFAVGFGGITVTRL